MGVKLYQAGDSLVYVLEWSLPLRIPQTGTLCPLSLGPGFYIIGLFLEKQNYKLEMVLCEMVKEAFHLSHEHFQLPSRLSSGFVLS